MTDFGFASQLRALPLASNQQKAAEGIGRWLTALSKVAEADSVGVAKTLASDRQGQGLLNSVFGNSHYLSECAARDPVFALKVFADGPQSCFSVAMEQVRALCERDLEFAEIARELRREKRNAALALAVGDISGTWDGQKVTAHLTEFADMALRAACAHVLREIDRQGAIKLPHPDRPEAGSGLIVLGMGKYGAGELNYSSDIDLIIFYDEDLIETKNPWDLQKYFVRLARRLLALLNERTGDGYVFRIDLRLRPDAGATQLAIPVKYGLTYYQQRALDWERAAMIKARAVAGDLSAGNSFLHQLQTFIWQENLDFAAVKEIRTIKRQIDIHKGRSVFSVPGHNVKLGRGGIREIEFFVQAQQLVWGGRIPSVRCRGTIDGIDALVRIGQVLKPRADDLKEAYHFLRWVEHRVQMINDEQTHTIPEDEDSLLQLAVFLGYEDAEDFSRELMNRLEFVSSVFVDLFDITLLPRDDIEVAKRYSASTDDGQPGDVAMLVELGFSNAHIADQTIRRWFRAELAATKTKNASEALSDLMPMLLKVIGGSARPDHTLQEFDKLLSHVPADLQFVSMLHTHPQIVGMLGNIVGKAPQIVDFLCGHPEVLESILIYDFFDPVPGIEDLHREINDRLSQARTVSEISTACQKWLNERKFQVAVQLLGGLAEPAPASHALCNLTEAAVQAMAPRIACKTEGGLSEDGFVILALGDLGSGEMIWTSHLNLVLVPVTPLEGTDIRQVNRFATLTRSLAGALVPPPYANNTSKSCRDGDSTECADIPTWRLEDLAKKDFGSASVSELLALTRARAIFGCADLPATIQKKVLEILSLPKDREGLRSQIGARLVAVPSQEAMSDMWASAALRRNLSNLELAVRYLQLTNVEDDADLLDPGVRCTLEKLRGADFLDANVANDLIFAADLWNALLGVLSVATGETNDSDGQRQIPDDLRPRLAQIADAPDFEACTELLKETSDRINGHISQIFQ